MKLCTRGRAPIIKKKNIPLIICSNLSPHEVYSNSDRVLVDALAGRFKVVHAYEMINMHWCKEDDSNDDTAEMYSTDDEMNDDF